MNHEYGSNSAENAFEAGFADSAVASSRAHTGLREALIVLFKHKKTILFTFVTFVAAATVVAFLMPPVYQAESKLLIKFGRENVYRPEGLDDKSQVVTPAGDNEDTLNSETNILTSRDLVAEVVSAMTVERLYPDLGKAAPRRGTPLEAGIERFEKDLSVVPLKKSSVIQVSLQHKDPRMAAQALKMLVDDFKEKHLQAYSDPKSSYLEQQLVSYNRRLQDSQDQLEAFKQQNRVFSLDEQRSLLLKQQGEFDTVLKETENQISEGRERMSSLQRALQTVSPDLPMSTDVERYRSIDDANGQLLALQLKEQELLRTYTDSNQLVINVRREIQVVQRFIDNQQEAIKGRLASAPNAVYQDLQKEILNVQADLPSRQAKAVSLRTQIAQLDSDIRSLDLTGKELDNLKRDVSMNDRTYQAYQEKLQEAQILEDLNRQKSANISVIEEAAVPVTPVKPRKALYIAIGVALGGLSGLALAFVREVAGQSLSTPQSVERRLGLPVLATIALKR